MNNLFHLKWYERIIKSLINDFPLVFITLVLVGVAGVVYVINYLFGKL